MIIIPSIKLVLNLHQNYGYEIKSIWFHLHGSTSALHCMNIRFPLFVDRSKQFVYLFFIAEKSIKLKWKINRWKYKIKKKKKNNTQLERKTDEKYVLLIASRLFYLQFGVMVALKGFIWLRENDIKQMKRVLMLRRLIQLDVLSMSLYECAIALAIFDFVQVVQSYI